MRSKVTLQGRPILELHAPSSGLMVESALYEALDVARDYGYKPFAAKSWEELEIDKQAVLIAHRRLRLHSEAVLAHRQTRKHGKQAA